MNAEQMNIFGLATLLAAIGMWLMLPRGGARGRMLGVVAGLASLGLFASQVPRLGDWASNSVFYVLAAVTIIAAAATVTFRSPVYCAIWFALSLLGTAGLFLFQGAQFLGVATVVVYAGAILVTFLFVLMLAQPAGQAFYDRLSWEALLSAATGSLLVGMLTLTVTSVLQKSSAERLAKLAAVDALMRINGAAAPSGVPRFDDLQELQTAEDRRNNVLADHHMARLGAQLFSRYLIGVEVAGTLLLVALVGTVAIVSQVKPARGRVGSPVPAGDRSDG